MRCLVLLTGALAAASPAALAGGGEGGPGFPVGTAPIAAEIERNLAPDDAPFCTGFRVDGDRVLGWLGRTWPVPLRWIADDLYSPCAVEATIRMEDGSEGTLILRSSGAGQLTLADGEVLPLFGPLLWADPVGGPYFNLD